MHLFHRIGADGYYGTIVATFIGYTFSNVLSLTFLKKKLGFSYKETAKELPRAALSCLLLLGLGITMHLVLPTDSHSRLTQLFNVAVSGVVLGGVYVIINRKTIGTILPERLAKKLKLI